MALHLMRIIAGHAKGRRIHGPPGRDTRPMTDRVREAVFSALGGAVDGADVLDLFAGSGSIGLEALSRGAERAVFVERSRPALEVLRSNIERVGLGGEVHRADVATYLAGAEEPFDLVFVDPPYGMATAEVEEILAAIERWTVAGAIVVLHRRRGDPDPSVSMNLVLEDERSYGGSHVIRYRREGT